MLPRVHTGRAPRPRALLWDSRNTSTLLVARSLVDAGWAVDAIGGRDSGFLEAGLFEDVARVESPDEALAAMRTHPLDALFLHGDDQVRAIVERYDRLPPSIRRHLPDREALEIALSKERSAEFARRLGLPVLPTIRCASPAEVAQASRELAPGGEVVLKADASSAGSGIRALRAGDAPDAALWSELTQGAPFVSVQRAIAGPRLLATVVYERGRERAACLHEKLAAFPERFGISARGVTRRLDEVLDLARRLLEVLAWHGLGNVEFRQDLADGRWYFMEMNPRVPSSLGIQAQAGCDVARAWAEISRGNREAAMPGRAYRDGVRYAWCVPLIASGLKHPIHEGAAVPFVMTRAGDWSVLPARERWRAFKLGAWLARHR